MKKLYKLSLIVFIPIILGIVLNAMGGKTENAQLASIGRMILSIGVPVTMFLLVVIGLILFATGKAFDDGNKQKSKRNNDAAAEKENDSDIEQTGEREREYSEIADVNTSYSYESHLRQGSYLGRHMANNYKNSTLKQKILGWLFFGFLMTDFALIFLFTFLRNMVGIIVCFSIFGGTILLAMIVKIILERTSMNVNLGRLKNEEISCGKVSACLLSSMASTGGSSRRMTTRITGVVYRVLITDGDREYTAYTEDFYETGEDVHFVAIGKHRAAIVKDADLTGEE